MKKAKVLFISQEITPYLPENHLSHIGRNLPQGIQENGKEIRTFMPRFGCINERRNQLHEVIRLSGMNMVIDDSDHPLIIKVASIQAARMQVYFIDNEEYFQRKAVIRDKEGKFFADNDERMMFFCRGVLETVKKLGWIPDIVHCHGWMTSLVPLYLKTLYKEDPMFGEPKVVYSIYDNKFTESLDERFAEKVWAEEGIEKDDVEWLSTPNFVNLNKLAVEFSDAVVKGSETVDGELEKHIASKGLPVLDYQSPETYIDAYNEFYDEVLLGESVLVD